MVLRLLVHLVPPDNQLELAKNAVDMVWKTARTSSHSYHSARGIPSDQYYPNALRR